MADKPLQLKNGSLTEVEGTVVSSGAGSAGAIGALDPTGRFDISLMPIGMGPSAQQVVVSGTLSAGDLVNIFDDAGTAKCRQADANSIATEANGFVTEAYTDGQTATVFFVDSNEQVSGLPIGVQLFLSDSSPGGVTATPPTGTGKIVQKIGKAVSPTALVIELKQPVVLG